MDNSHGRNTEKTQVTGPSPEHERPNPPGRGPVPNPNSYPANVDPMLPQSFTWPQIPTSQLPVPAEGRLAAGVVLSLTSASGSPVPGHSNAPNSKATTTLSRSSLTDGQRLQIVRLCCQGEEYLRSKEDFWTKRTTEFNRATGKTVSNARTVVTRLYIKYRSDIADVHAYSYLLNF